MCIPSMSFLSFRFCEEVIPRGLLFMRLFRRCVSTQLVNGFLKFWALVKSSCDIVWKVLHFLHRFFPKRASFRCLDGTLRVGLVDGVFGWWNVECWIYHHKTHLLRCLLLYFWLSFACQLNPKLRFGLCSCRGVLSLYLSKELLVPFLEWLKQLQELFFASEVFAEFSVFHSFFYLGGRGLDSLDTHKMASSFNCVLNYISHSCTNAGNGLTEPSFCPLYDSSYAI